MLLLSKEAAYRKMVGEAMIIIDVCPNYSQLPTAADVLNLKAAGVGGAIVGGEVIDLTLWRDYIAAYRDLFCGIYAFVEFEGDPLASISTGLRAIDGTPCTYFGVDIELEATPDVSANLGIIQHCIDEVNTARPDVETLPYTAGWWWRKYAAGSTETFGCRGWIAGGPNYANADESLPPPDPTKMVGTGGWDVTNTAFWQYQASVNTAGINSDRNVRVMEGEMTPQEKADIEAKFTALVQRMAGDETDITNLKAIAWRDALRLNALEAQKPNPPLPPLVV